MSTIPVTRWATLQFARIALLLAASLPVAQADEKVSFRDPEDGAFDVSAFLDTAYGFIPVIAPITEPAVGYGAVGALIFIDRNEPVDGHPIRPNIAAGGGLGTENGTDGLFGAHVGHWDAGRLRTFVGLADMGVNLEFFGVGQDEAAPRDQGLEYTVNGSGGAFGASYRPWENPVWIGLRYLTASTDVRLRDSQLGDLVPARDLDQQRLAALTPSVLLDTRDNPFTPTRGYYMELSAPIYRDEFGSDRDFEIYDVDLQGFHPLNDRLNSGLRVGWRDSSSGTPFYLRPYVNLRGVQAMRYQGESVIEGEAELRWQWRPRIGLLAFGGGGVAQTERSGDESIASGGVGMRYLIARTYGLHMGIDVAWGPDDPVFYVIFGSAWLRP